MKTFTEFLSEAKEIPHNNANEDFNPYPTFGLNNTYTHIFRDKGDAKKHIEKVKSMGEKKFDTARMGDKFVVTHNTYVEK